MILFDFIIGLMMQTLRADRILLVTNSSIAQSDFDAQAYISARGLSDRRLAYNFGNNTIVAANDLKSTGTIRCQTAPYQNQFFTESLAAYYLTHGIDAVILSTYTPSKILNAGAPPFVHTLSAFAGGAIAWNAVDPGAAGFRAYFAYLTYDTQSYATLNEMLANVIASWRLGESANVTRAIPHGRLGCPNYDSVTISERAVRSTITGESIATYATRRALEQEQRNHARKSLHALTNSLTYSIISVAENTQAYDLALRNIYAPLQNMVVDDFVMSGGGSIHFNAPIFAVCLANEFNIISWNYGSTLANTFSCEYGAWGYVWTSFAGQFGSDVLYNGGSAALLTFGEPLAIYIPEPQQMFAYANYYQLPLMLAAFLAHSNGGLGVSVCGDPLYSPYANSSVRPLQRGGSPYA